MKDGCEIKEKICTVCFFPGARKIGKNFGPKLCLDTGDVRIRFIVEARGGKVRRARMPG